MNISNLARKTWFKTITFFLIHAFLLLDVAWASEIKSINPITSATLSPKTLISEQLLHTAFGLQLPLTQVLQSSYLFRSGRNIVPVVNTPVDIQLIGLGSPDHYNTWNNLSLETLAGDLHGYFSNNVNVQMNSVNQPEQINSLVDQVLSGGQPHLLGISVQPGSLPLVEQFIDTLKNRPGFDINKTLIVFGNQLPTYFPVEILSVCPEGVVVRGEGEIALRGLVELLQGTQRLAAIPNLTYLDRSSQSIIYHRLERPDLEKLIYPPVADTYASIIERGGNVQVVSSRGCFWGLCVYCTRRSFRNGGVVIPGKDNNWESFPEERIFKNLEEVIVDKGIIEVEFSDDDFLGGRSDERIARAYAISNKIEALREQTGHQISFRIFVRPKDIYDRKNTDEKNKDMKQLLERLKEVGLVKVFIGIETGSASQLRRYGRQGKKIDEVLEAITILRDLEIGVDTGFIMFDPELTIPEMLENVRFFRDNDLMLYNQWPFRSMAVNQGARTVEMMRKKGLLGKPDVNSMSYGLRFKDKEVEAVKNLLDDINMKTMSLFYALKMKSKKYFDPLKQDEGTMRAQEYVEANGYIYLDLMEKLGLLMLKTPPRKEREAKIAELRLDTEKRVHKLFKDLEKDIADNIIPDEDGYLSGQLKTLMTPSDVVLQEITPLRPDVSNKKALNSRQVYIETRLQELIIERSI